MRTLIRSHGTAIACPMAPADMPAAILARSGAWSLGLSPQKKARMYSYPMARKPVYGMWRAIAGVTPAYRPTTPSVLRMLAIMPPKPNLVPVKSAWPWSCRRVLVISIGKVAPSASIDDAPVRQNFFAMPARPEPVSALREWDTRDCVRSA